MWYCFYKVGSERVKSAKCQRHIFFLMQEGSDIKKQCDAVLSAVIMRSIICSGTWKHLIFRISIVRSDVRCCLSQTCPTCPAFRVGIWVLHRVGISWDVTSGIREVWSMLSRADLQDTMTYRNCRDNCSEFGERGDLFVHNM